ncbi:MAG: type IV pili twitching motility protein PilT [Zetaproteobacteria bacterium]|nr:type IV pili twitching motility protein PilT [Pseudobdellovibrionaceae bacterium]|tara:strand:- start:1083 stop:2150 length:1068 start_codon:yes stop_codon:yes gene_type:complete
MEYNLPQLFKTLIDQGASDLHISALTPPRLRIDGQLVPLNLPALTPEQSMSLCYSILTESQKKSFEESKEIDLAFSIRDLARFRANIYLERNHVAGAFRVIPFKIYTVQDLGLPSIITKICNLPRGLVLVTGPTGSGKSTTLAAMIDYINTHRFDHIVTIEDPVEFIHPHRNCVVNQREIGEDTETFAVALKSILRQDPDVVMVGEMRDPETIASALTIAETGHLVFGTLHTNSCVTSLNRIIDSFPPFQQNQVRNQLSMSLEAVVSQILVPASSGGRVQAMEIMIPNTAIRALIYEGKFNQIYSAMQTGQSESDMKTMNQSLRELVRKRFISREMAMSKSSNPIELSELIKKVI